MLKIFSILTVSGFMLASCNNSADSSTAATTDTTTVDTTTVTAVVVEEAYPLPPVEEHKVAGVHMNKKHHAAKKAGKTPTELDVIGAELDYETVEVDVLTAALIEADAQLAVIPPPPPPVVVVDTVTVSKAAVVLNQDQKVVAIGKKDSKTSSMEIISDPTDPNTISQIRFTDKRHKDVFNVQAGMSAKDVRKLRRDMKYMKRNGKDYLYSDKSNIMYELTVSDSMSGESATAVGEVKATYTSDQVDAMTVGTIVWKNNTKKKK